MAFVEQGLVPGDIFAQTLPGEMSFRTVTFLAGTNYGLGSILGRVTASGKYKLYDPAASDGSQNAIAIAAVPVDATAGDKLGSIGWQILLFRRQKAVWGPGVTTQAHRNAAELSLESKGILAVNEG